MNTAKVLNIAALTLFVFLITVHSTSAVFFAISILFPAFFLASHRAVTSHELLVDPPSPV